MNKEFLLFAGQRLISCGVALLVIITLTFFLMKTVPGDSFTQEQALPKETYAALKSYYGFDQPLYVQYKGYVKNILSGDLGPSLIYQGRTTTQIITEAFPVSGFLGLQAILLAGSVSIFAGLACAFFKNSKIDTSIGMFATLLLSTPSFLLAASLQYFLGIYCDWLPVGRWDSMTHTLMPTIALASMPAAFLTKLIRTNMLDVLKQDYIFFARTKGLSEKTVLLRHALKNALIPLFGYFGKMCANILVGSFIIEKIFCIPGLGYWFVTSINHRDYPLIMGLTIFFSCVLLAAIFIAEIAHALLDTRLYRHKEELLT